MKKNRSPCIQAFTFILNNFNFFHSDDHSRVVLLDTRQDYINANYIDVSIHEFNACNIWQSMDCGNIIVRGEWCWWFSWTSLTHAYSLGKTCYKDVNGWSFIISSPELKAQVSFSYHNLSAVRPSCRCRCCCKFFTFSSSTPEPLDQFQPNLAQIILGWWRFKFVQKN